MGRRHRTNGAGRKNRCQGKQRCAFHEANDGRFSRIWKGSRGRLARQIEPQKKKGTTRDDEHISQGVQMEYQACAGFSPALTTVNDTSSLRCMSSYKHKQPGRVIVISMTSAALIAMGFGVRSHLLPVVLPVVCILLLSAILFSSLTIEIADGRLAWRFGPGLIHKSVSLAELSSVEPVRIRWWNGWGIHLTGNGWLYNVSGMEAVKVSLKSGKTFMLGTDEPQQLAEALRLEARP
jgi:hypothetical protein